MIRAFAAVSAAVTVWSGPWTALNAQVTPPSNVTPSEPQCQPKVVHCNYAHLYSGTFSWQSNLAGEWGKYDRTVTITVANGLATCAGGETEVSISEVQGQRVSTTEVGQINGPGLIAVEFDHDDESGNLVYRVTGACPSPTWRPGLQRPVEPAKLGSSYEEQSYNQPASAIGINLNGVRDEPAAETDEANGVTGRVKVTWALKRT